MASRRTRKDADLGPDSRETEALERDRVKQERAVGTAVAPRLARRHIHTTHPDHGEPVVFVPGELLPDWVKVTD